MLNLITFLLHLQIKDEMEKQLSVPTLDGGFKTETEVVSEVLLRSTVKPEFLWNVGILHPSRSKISNLSTKLEREKRGSAELQDVVCTQRDQVKELTSQVQQAEKNKADMQAKIASLTRIIEQQR